MVKLPRSPLSLGTFLLSGKGWKGAENDERLEAVEGCGSYMGGRSLSP